jgi:uncharacterized RDD family membrane protein YckC
MTEQGPLAARGDELPPAPATAAGNGAGAPAVSAHALAEAQAQAAAAERVRVHIGAERTALDYTGLVTRAIAFGVDALIIDLVAAGVAAIIVLALNLLQVPSEIDTMLAAIGAVALILWAAAYFVTFWSTTGQTPGARVMRFRVLAPGAERGRIGPGRAIVRLIGMTLAAIPLLAGYWMVLFNDRRRGLHDYIAGTVVIDAPDTATAIRRLRTRAQPPAA